MWSFGDYWLRALKYEKNVWNQSIPTTAGRNGEQIQWMVPKPGVDWFFPAYHSSVYIYKDNTSYGLKIYGFKLFSV